MTCNELSRFIDVLPLGQRRPEEMEKARRHAAGCPECAARLADAEALEGALAALPSVEPSDRLLTSVMERITADPVEEVASRQAAAATEPKRASTAEKLGWAAAITTNLGLLTAYLYRAGVPGWLERALPTGVGGPATRDGLIFDAPWQVVAGIIALLLAAGIFAIASGGEHPDRPAR